MVMLQLKFILPLTLWFLPFTTASLPVKQSLAPRTIHVFVALCDNKYQGIVPVPAAIGNGQNPKNNLYWGAGYGIKSFFTSKSKDWKLISSQADTVNHILERLLFKHRSKDIYLLADAYDGKYIRKTTIDFLNASAGKNKLAVKTGDKEILFGGAANLVSYIGHDGLMDFTLTQAFQKEEGNKKDAIILACYSKNYFSHHLKNTGAIPIVWTTGLMAPEAYTLHDAIQQWTENKPVADIRIAAASAYAKYQKCGTRAALRLLVSGW
jgi:hypothetical protein